MPSKLERCNWFTFKLSLMDMQLLLPWASAGPSGDPDAFVRAARSSKGTRGGGGGEHF
jgi:hypothetical protein